MKVLVFGASTSSDSINHRLALYAAEILKQQHAAAEIETLDLKDYEMPIYSADRENNDGVPDKAQSFLDVIKKSDALIISFPEHNGSYTAAFKNVFDWASRLNAKVFQDKKMIALSTSPGKFGGATVLEQFMNRAPFFGADVKAHLSVGSFQDVFDQDSKTITDQEIDQKLKQAVISLLSD